MTSSRRHDPPKARPGTRSSSKSAAGKVLPTPKAGNYKAVAASALKRLSETGELASKALAKPRVKVQQPAWLLQDAKARFSELVRRVKIEGPQQVSVHGKVEVVVMSADEYRRLKGEKTGAALIAALQASPHRDVDIAPSRAPMPVRAVEL